jgi:lipoyl(octanoyl) transferase
VRSFWLGTAAYGDALRLQESLATVRREGACGDTLLLLEHPPTITLGRAARPAHILAPPERLRELGLAVVETGRGGDVTYHCPGQLVGYPIVDLSARGRDLHAYMRTLEQALIDALAALGVEARRFRPHTGVWVGDAKIAALGIRVSRWVTTHGFALNVGPDLDGFNLIVPCGIHEYGATSLERVTGRRWTVAEVLPAVVAVFEAYFGVEAGGGEHAVLAADPTARETTGGGI